MSDEVNRQMGSPCAICRELTPENKTWRQYVCEDCRVMSHKFPAIREAMAWYMECFKLPAPLKDRAYDEAEASLLHALDRLANLILPQNEDNQDQGE